MQKRRNAVSKAKKGIPLSVELRKKLSNSLKQNKPCLCISPDNEILKFKDYREFKLISTHTLDDKIQLSKRINNFTIILAGKYKGWIIHYNINIKIDFNYINEFRNNEFKKTNKNRSIAVSKTQTKERRIYIKNFLSKQLILIDNDKVIHKFNNYKDLKEKFPDRPISTIQTKSNKKPVRSGPWMGWIKI